MKEITARFRTSSEPLPDLLAALNQQRLAIIKSADKHIQHTRSRLAERLQGSRKRAAANGYRAGLKSAQTDLNEVIDSLKQVRAELVKDCQEELLELCQSICTQVIAAELTSTPESIAARISRVLDEFAANPESLAIRVNPDDLERAQMSLRASLPAERLELKSDDKVEVGNSVIELASGEIELDWNRHLSKIVQHLHFEMRSARGAASK